MNMVGLPNEAGVDQQGVLVGMSGGVDSAVAALVLQEQGYRVTGVTLRLWRGATAGDWGSAPGEEGVERAKIIAAALGIPHLVVDAGDLFRATVVEYFIHEYERGSTPNPCVKCNSRFRFKLLLDIARRQGLGRIATGHYARLRGDPPCLARGLDLGKDQSYVLAEVAPELLRRCIFPLGGLTKAEVKARAEEAGLGDYVALESQEICFIPDDDYHRFLKEHLGERPGVVVDGAGRKLAEHKGIYNFTVGQRKGLGIASSEPQYVTALRAERQEVVVGPATGLAVGAIELGDLVRHRAAGPAGLVVQWRSAGGVLPARFTDRETTGIIFPDRPASAVSPGQSAVLYQGDAVVLAGTILSTAPPGAAWKTGPAEGGNSPCDIVVQSGADQKGA